MQIHLSRSREEAKNTSYPYLKEIGATTETEELQKIFSRDYVTATYRENKRSNDNFISTDCLALDLDNDHSDNPTEWITVETIKQTFGDIFYVIHKSRNDMKEKGNKAARPRFHILFSIEECKSAKEYTELKKRVYEFFPYFDDNALDAARFFFGTDPVEVEVNKGTKTINAFLEEMDDFANLGAVIPEGQRNSYMHRYAISILKRYGHTDETKEKFIQESNKCDPLLSKSELQSIWKSALNFFNNKILKDPNYKAPEEFNETPDKFKPSDYTDVGQATIFSKHYKDVIAYNEAFKYMVYKEGKWQEGETFAIGMMQEFTKKQLEEATLAIKLAHSKVTDHMHHVMISSSKNKWNEHFSDEERKIYKDILEAEKYKKFAEDRRNSNYILASLKQSAPLVYVSDKEFDNKPFLLVTPKGTYDLRVGLESLRPNSPSDFSTKMAGTSPSDKGKEMFLESLNKIFGKDKELIEYVQRTCGLALIGKIYCECLIIAHGEGGNGKSTFWNTIGKVFGDYGGLINADNLFVSNKASIKFETAFMKGKRLLIAGENKEGERLDDGTVKKLCSTDRIKGEKKYKDEFDFEPTHLIVLYTNHLPKVGATDDGIWRRLVVIPFNYKFQGSEDNKNFSETLFQEAGEYILKWIMEGSKKIIEDNYKIETPEAVKKATQSYRDNNDWFHIFLNECCDLTDKKARTGVGELYDRYKRFSSNANDYTRPISAFKAQLEKMKINIINRHNKKICEGIKILEEVEEAFLSQDDDDELLT